MLSGKKARRKTNRAKQEAAAAAAADVSFTEQLANMQNPSKLPYRIGGDFPGPSRLPGAENKDTDEDEEVSLEPLTRSEDFVKLCLAPAKVAKELKRFISSAKEAIIEANENWIELEFGPGCDCNTLEIAASTGNIPSLLAMVYRNCDKRYEHVSQTISIQHSQYSKVWIKRLYGFDRYNLDALLWDGLAQFDVEYLLAVDVEGLKIKHIEREAHIRFLLSFLRGPAERGSATAQFVMGMLIYHTACSHPTGIKQTDHLDAARWIRKAAVQGVMEAQYELGEIFRLGLFCTVRMRFARNYIRRASKQGHVQATARMKELRSCALCGADDAPLVCSSCHQARYCDSTCSDKHWFEGGGVSVGEDVYREAAALHLSTCPRTHTKAGKAARAAHRRALLRSAEICKVTKAAKEAVHKTADVDAEALNLLEASKEAAKETADKDGPNRPPGPYMLFCTAMRPKIIAANPTFSLGEVANAINVLWNQN